MKKYKIMMVSVLTGALVLAGNAKVALNKAELAISNNKHSVNLAIDSMEDVYGLQFDLNYNANELTFVDAKSVVDGYMFDYKVKEDGLIRGLIFSMEGKKLLNAGEISDIIDFEFESANGFVGKSVLTFADVILAGENGKSLDVISSSYEYDVSNILLPTETALSKSYPNPFNPVTTIHYELAIENMVELAVYDLRGRLVAELVNNIQVPGFYNVAWDASDQASGTYIVKMIAGEYTNTQKVMLVK